MLCFQYAAFAEYAVNEFVEDLSAFGEVEQIDSESHQLYEVRIVAPCLTGNSDLGRVYRRTGGLEQVVHLVERVNLLAQFIAELGPNALDEVQLPANLLRRLPFLGDFGRTEFPEQGSS